MHTHVYDGPSSFLNVLSENSSWFLTVNKSAALNPCCPVHGIDKKKLLPKLSEMPPTPRLLPETLHKNNLNDPVSLNARNCSLFLGTIPFNNIEYCRFKRW